MENKIEIKNSLKKKSKKAKKVNEKKTKTKTKIKIKGDKKEKNKNTQSIKINISSSGGLGGSGGGGVPNIPMPIQTFSRSEKIGENVDVGNILKRIENQQQSAINNLANVMNTSVIPAIMQNQNSIFEGEFEPEIERKDLRNYQDRPLLEQINRDDKIDQAEKINVEPANIEDLYINNPTVPLIDNPLTFKRKQKKDKIPPPEQSIQLEPSPPPPEPEPEKRPRGRPKKIQTNINIPTPKIRGIKGAMSTRKTTK